jgi:hypothetical protein
MSKKKMKIYSVYDIEKERKRGKTRIKIAKTKKRARKLRSPCPDRRGGWVSVKIHSRGQTRLTLLLFFFLDG